MLTAVAAQFGGIGCERARAEVRQHHPGHAEEAVVPDAVVLRLPRGPATTTTGAPGGLMASRDPARIPHPVHRVPQIHRLSQDTHSTLLSTEKVSSSFIHTCISFTRGVN
jgi:hypothetical protein